MDESIEKLEPIDLSVFTPSQKPEDQKGGKQMQVDQSLLEEALDRVQQSERIEFGPLEVFYAATIAKQRMELNEHHENYLYLLFEIELHNLVTRKRIYEEWRKSHGPC